MNMTLNKKIALAVNRFDYNELIIAMDLVDKFKEVLELNKKSINPLEEFNPAVIVEAIDFMSQNKSRHFKDADEVFLAYINSERVSYYLTDKSIGSHIVNMVDRALNSRLAKFE